MALLGVDDRRGHKKSAICSIHDPCQVLRSKDSSLFHHLWQHWLLTKTSTSWDLAIFMLMMMTTTTEPITIPLAHAHGVRLAEVSRNGRIKQYTNKSGRDKNRQDLPYILFSSNRVSMKRQVGMHLLVFLSLPLLFVYFLILPSLRTSAIF